MNVKSFFVSALTSALDLGLASSDDVVKHITADVLATHLPRPLWARLLTACVGAARVDAQLIIETIGVPNLCEHVPTPIIWACLAEVAERSLGGVVAAPREIVTRSGSQPVSSKAVPLSTPPPPEAKPRAATPTPPSTAVGPSIPRPGTAPLTSVLDELSAEEGDKPSRSRTPTSQRFRQTNTNIGRLAAANQTRRPQASATAPTPDPSNLDPATVRAAAPRVRRGETEAEFDMETDISASGKDDWKGSLAVEDEQLVDWSSSEETMTATNDTRDDSFGRKR